jgi:hypothetical protein
MTSGRVRGVWALKGWAAVIGAVGLSVVAAGLAGPAPRAVAKPPGSMEFCKIYPNAHVCAASPMVNCTTCHTVPPARNLFGEQVAANLAPGAARPLSDADYIAALPAALKAVEALDADGDGISNLAELIAGSQPELSSSRPTSAGCTPGQAKTAAAGRWNTCGYDPAHAYRKVTLDVCGRSPTRAETEAFRRLLPNESAWRGALSDRLDQCLRTPYWLGVNGVLWNLANAKISPVDSIKAGPRAGSIPLADYEWDYNLFAWLNTGDRDVRGLLTGQDFVKRVSDSPPTFEPVPEEGMRGLRQAGQTVPREKRAGMITTRWFTTVNTMFTPIPRTTAAAAYRQYLGLDLARMQGLHPAVSEPADYDAKGVAAPACAVCHSTLDPLTYPFTRYDGIIRNNYNPNRLKNFVRTDGPRVVEAPEAGEIFGQKVANLMEWSQVAANSDAFAQKVVWDYWKLMVGREPGPADQTEFTLMWKGLKAQDKFNYRTERMLHALVLTEAYGRP